MLPGGSASKALAGMVEVPDAAGAQQSMSAPVLQLLSMQLKASISTDAIACPPDHVTVSPFERVTESGLTPGGGLVKAGSVGIVIDVWNAGTSAPPGTLMV